MKNVLIVDSEEDFVKHLTEVLRDYQKIFSVVRTKNNKNAIDILNEIPIDLIVLDFKIPKTDELELLSYIDLKFPAITIILTSRYGISKVKKSLDSIGVYKIFKKPIVFEKMAKSIIEGLKIIEDQGSATGISIETFLQILSLDQKTCLLEVISNGNKPGYYFIKNGILYDAIFGNRVGIKAAIKMLNLEKVTLNLKKLPSKKIKNKINTSIMALLLENSKDKDEKNSDEIEQTNEITDSILKPVNIKENPINNNNKEPDMSKSKLDLILLKFRDEIPEYISTSIVEISTGMSVAGDSILTEFDTAAASAAFADVIKSTEIGLNALGGSDNAGSTEEILISTDKVILLVSILGNTGYYHGLAITKKGNLGFARVIMKKYLSKIVALLKEVVGV
ncbi:response regulator [Desulfobacula phenolica]|uniref:Response regulator receiver protein n=1 Tax=Desulfobacula phenolica TaxID=90732 RepID=A0A1H2K0J0_9BACT|nr:response regulator [Desulfobacula phenolica]SDU61855.1 response regulator receiver protein [Desulfobacula phenolica]